MAQKSKIIIILGPTASGKSALAVKLAKQFNDEIISADSRQIYKGIDIASGKITKKEMRSVPHHLISIASPKKIITVAQWKKLAEAAIKKILTRNQIPIICGGAGLYISALVDNFQIPKGAADTTLRLRLEQKSAKELFFELKKIDPKTAKTIDKNNKRRLVRALEVTIKTGQSFKKQQTKAAPKYDFLQIGINTPRDELSKKISKRVDQMVKKGLFREAKKLLKNYKTTLPSMSGIGYKEIERFLKGGISKKSAIEQIKQNTRHYAKRQMTWFKRDKRIRWIRNYPEAEKLVKQFLRG